MKFGPDNFLQKPFTCWLDFFSVGVCLFIEIVF